MISNLKSKITVVVIFLSFTQAICQIQPYFKAGVNFGFINKDQWISSGFSDNYDYGKALIRPIVSFGLTETVNQFSISVAVMHQTKGQGSKTPRARSFDQTLSPDIIHFMSFPITLEYSILKKLGLSFSIQPSMYLGGADNYWASEIWRGWIWSGVAGVTYELNKTLEIGFEFDHDFRLYYCPGCDHRFLTYRFYTSMPIGQVPEDKHQDGKRLKNKKH